MVRTTGGDVRVAGYFPGAIGKITELHAVYYFENWSFDLSFESQVGRELSEFMSRFQEGRDGFWTAFVGDEFAGAVAIDGDTEEEFGARLRWFIVDPRFQGWGVGARLIEKALEFCRKAGYQAVHLWTFQGLEAARILYERAGFRLYKEECLDKWGGCINEQMYLLRLEPGNSVR